MSGTFVVARTGVVEQLDPAAATAAPTAQTLGLVYDTLLDTNQEGQLVPGLAKEWQVSADGTTVSFTLRQGVTFHNGAAFTAKDAEATLDRILEGKTDSALRPHLHNVERIATPSPSELVLHLKEPDAALLTALTRVGASMLDSGDIKAGTVARAPNGTGAFRWASWKRGRRVTLVANRSYWDGAPRLSRVALRVAPEESAVVSGTQAGRFDLGLVSDPGAVRGVDSADVRVKEQATLSYYTLMLDTRRGPLGMVKVRQAIACAINRNQVIETVYFGHGKVTGPIISPAYAAGPTAGLPCEPPDRQKAKALLAGAGYGDGITLDATVAAGRDDLATSVARSLQAQLQKVGVRLRVKRQEPGAARDDGRAGDFEATVARVEGSYDPYLLYHRYTAGDGNRTAPAGLSSERLINLLRKANTTTDRDERRRVLRRLQREMLRLSPWVWLLRSPVFYLAGENVRGFEPDPTQSLESLRSTRLIENES